MQGPPSLAGGFNLECFLLGVFRCLFGSGSVKHFYGLAGKCKADPLLKSYWPKPATDSRKLRGLLVAELEPNDAPKCLHAVFPGDFFPLFIRPPGIADWHFINSPVALGNFCGNFRLKSKPIRFQLNILQHLAPEHLVARLHIGQLQVGENIGKQSQRLVGNVVPEIMHALTLLSDIFTNLKLTDMETCYKVFRREVLKDIQLKSNRFGFEPEITAKIAKGNWRVYEVPISYAGRTYEEGKKITWKDGVQALWCIIRFKFSD